LTNDKLFTKVATIFGYGLYNFFPIFKNAIKVCEESNMNTPPIQLMKLKLADKKQIQEFGNNIVNKLIVLHFTTSSKLF
jgi:hypothetical protein